MAAAYYNRGRAYTSQGNTAQAIADFQKALNLTNDPNMRSRAEAQLDELRAE